MFDFKKELKELYAPKQTPQIITVKEANFIAVRGEGDIDYAKKDKFSWVSVIRTPEFITQEDFCWAVKTAEKKKKIDCGAAEFLSINEGLCVQILHVGAFEDEPISVAKMNEFIAQNGFKSDLSDAMAHHEIYLSDPRKTAASKYKTIIRQPICPL